MGKIAFGTDGWRAVIADDFTFENVRRVAQATADFWRANPVPGTEPKVVIGFDRRFFSDAFAQTTAEVLAGNDFQVILSPGPTPTPSLSFTVKQSRAIGGIMLTASHNPPIFNGFKIKSHYGASADPAMCQAVERFLDKNPIRELNLKTALKTRKVRRVELRTAHFKQLKRLVNFELIAGSKLRFAHEALFGVGAWCFDELLSGTTCRVTTLNARHDPLFGGINPEPIEKNYAASSAYLRKHPHDICLVTDGDADRVGAMDGRGNPLSTHQVICLLLQHLYLDRKGRGRVVKALTTTSLVDKMCAAYGLDLLETGVGFKFIAAEMIKGDVLLGAEESGGIGFPGHIPERDGIAAGLFLLELLATRRLSVTRLLADLEREFGKHRYGRIDAQYPVDQRAELMRRLSKNPPDKLIRSPVSEVKSFDGVKFIAADSSWLMLRGSGTEPILRIYAEGDSDDKVDRLLSLGTSLVRKLG